MVIVGFVAVYGCILSEIRSTNQQNPPEMMINNYQVEEQEPAFQVGQGIWNYTGGRYLNWYVKNRTLLIFMN